MTTTIILIAITVVQMIAIYFLLRSVRKAEVTTNTVLKLLEVVTWRLSSLTRLILATGDDSLIDLADQILTAQKEEGNIPEKNGGN